MFEYDSLRVGAGKFIYGSGSIKALTREIISLGSRPLIIVGSIAKAVIDKFVDFSDFPSLGIFPEIIIHDGVCSKEFAHQYASIALAARCTCIVGIGGGKNLDLAKCTSVFSDLPVITVPTSIATCVASSTICVMYDENGRSDGSVSMHKECDTVIADTDVIATQPKRLLASGILDSMAKYPEVQHGQKIESYADCDLEKYISYVNSKALHEFIFNEAKTVYDGKGKLDEFILSLLLHTSLISGFARGSNQQKLAHGIYYYARTVFTDECRKFLHGEIVAVGIPLQLYFNGASSEEISEVRSLMEYMNMPLSLTEIGFDVSSKESRKALVDYLIDSTVDVNEKDRDKLERGLDLIV